jgi:hypothetical protein
MDWRGFENSLKTEARFFSRTAANHLASIFDGIDELQTRDGCPLATGAIPMHQISWQPRSTQTAHIANAR